MTNIFKRLSELVSKSILIFKSAYPSLLGMKRHIILVIFKTSTNPENI